MFYNVYACEGERERLVIHWVILVHALTKIGSWHIRMCSNELSNPGKVSLFLKEGERVMSSTGKS